jgi:nucleotide-binding universal stress UspA family protein
MAGSRGAEHPIVVGYDGSPDSTKALRWALGLAATTGQPVEVLVVREEVFPNTADGERWLDEAAHETAHHARTIVDEENATASVSVVNGRATKVLDERSSTAAMVVVGRRGHGSTSELLLGSVGQHLARHAQCSVAIIR